MKTEHTELLKRLEAYSADDPRAAFPFSKRLARDNGWSHSYAQRVVCEYKRFAFLGVAAGHPVTPSDEVDQAWHLHMLYTESYWKDFCGQVLGRPLHHHPTKGGDNERDKFHGWYDRTLESYRQFFGEEPAADIWPDPRCRFGEDIHFVRVNTERNWILQKPRLLPALMNRIRLFQKRTAWRLTLASALLALLASASGCELMATGGLWPFHLSGGEFLKSFIIAWLVSLGLAAWLRSQLRLPMDEAEALLPELDPYLVAYLSGKGDLAVNAAVVNLFNIGALKNDLNKPRFLPANPPQENAHPFEQAIYASVLSDAGASIAEVQKSSQPLLSVFDEQLKKFGLLVSGRQTVNALLFPLLIALLVPVIGAVKVSIGLSQGKPVGFLVILSIVATVVALLGFARCPHRSRRGDRVLAQLKSKYASLERAPLEDSHGLGPAVLPLALGLFGLSILANTALAEVEKTLRPRSEAGGCGGGCSGGADGGGCGGCGGCGG